MLKQYGGVILWQSVKYVTKQLLSVFKFLILTEERTDLGNLTSKRLELSLMVLLKELTYVQNVLEMAT
jgi:hypothetical protein